MSISYISTSSFPTKQANLVNVLNMCSSITKNKLKVYLFLKTKSGDKKKILKKQISKDFDLKGLDNIFIFRSFNFSGNSILYSIICSIKTAFLKIDFCFTRDPISGYICSLLNIPVILELHHPIEHLPSVEYFFLKKLKKKRKFLFLVVITNYLRKNYIEHNFKENKILVLPDGANLPEKKINSIYFKDKFDLEIFYVGSLYEGRGIELLIKLAKKMTTKRFHIVGGNQNQVINFKKITSKQRNIIFYGHVSHSQTKKFLYSADILVAPYQSEVKVYGGGNTVKWMSPLKVFEYMSFKKPIIISNLPVFKGILKDKYNCLLVNPNKICEWKHSILQIERNKRLAKKIAKQAFEDIKFKYSWDIRAKKVLSKFGKINRNELI